jgi:hypothetical protein
MIEYKITALKLSQLLTGISQKLQCNNRGTGEDTLLADHKNNLFDTKIRRQQGSQKLPTRYMLNDHVQNSERKNNQKNFHTFGRAEITTS